MKIKNPVVGIVLILTVTLMALLAFPKEGNAEPFKLRVATTPAGPGLRVVLTWPSVAGVQRYNIYRRASSATTYPTTPLNSAPIQPYRNCAQITSVIPMGSLEWKMIENAFAESADTPFDPCQIGTIGPAPPERYEVLQMLVRVRWKIAVVAGQGYNDTTVSNGTTYYYRISSVASDGSVIAILDSDVAITAGVPVYPPVPIGIQSWAGDSQVLIYWAEMLQVAGFNVYRADTGIFAPVSEVPVAARFRFDPEGNPLAAGAPWFSGFLDYQRWSPDTGLPDDHTVHGNPVYGPENGTAYDYKVKSVDIAGNESTSFSAIVTATPVDKTVPLSPVDVRVVADDVSSALEIFWLKVETDINNHPEALGMSGYRVYRYEDTGDPDTGATPVGGLISHPTNPGIIEVSVTDSAPILRPLYGEKTYWYRVEAIDTASNVSARSAAAGGHLKDITAPSSPTNVAAMGFDDFIRVTWKLNNEPDMDGYSIYRSLCHLGKWEECDERKKEIVTETDKETFVYREPCSGPFMLLGYVSQADAEAMLLTPIGSPYFEDRTVPAGSPLCYAYLIKALDRSQNMSGGWPIPWPTEEIVCERLREKIPPESAFISKLMARDASILIEWIGAPVQDIKAYHVYRADKESGPYVWVGGMTVELPPNSAIQLAAPYAPPPGSVVGCNTIPLAVHEGMSAGSLNDKTAVPHQIYWYKVAGIDQAGNETPLDKAVPVSTFTFSTAQPSAPNITSITEIATPCGLQIDWQPTFDSSKSKGFVLFRGDSSGGLFHQLGAIIQVNTYLDSNVVASKEYWYRVIELDATGHPSPLSVPKMGKVSP